jgi:hypothetical protein
MKKKETKREETKANVAYGMLDMAHGKPLEDAYTHIESLKKIKPASWFFDVVHTANQKPTAVEWGNAIIKFIHEQHPDLSDGNVNVILNLSTKKVLGARNLLFEILYKAKTENIKYEKN